MNGLQLIQLNFTMIVTINLKLVNLLYGMLIEFCTTESCPVMSAGPKYEYLWADGTNVKTPLKVSAAEYIEYLMTWVENQLNNETIFPSQIGNFICNALKVFLFQKISYRL